MPASFRLYKARGQPGHWYGYVEIDGVTYKIDAQHVGERVNKHFEGTVKRHLKADQGKLELRGGVAQRGERPAGGKSVATAEPQHGGRVAGANPVATAPVDLEFDDSVEDIR